MKFYDIKDNTGDETNRKLQIQKQLQLGSKNTEAERKLMEEL